MGADAFGHCIHAGRGPEVNRYPSGLSKRRRVELEPARLATTRHTPVGDDDVGL